jgi:hypothetical protein
VTVEYIISNLITKSYLGRWILGLRKYKREHVRRYVAHYRIAAPFLVRDSFTGFEAVLAGDGSPSLGSIRETSILTKLGSTTVGSVGDRAEPLRIGPRLDVSFAESFVAVEPLEEGV